MNSGEGEAQVVLISEEDNEDDDEEGKYIVLI